MLDHRVLTRQEDTSRDGRTHQGVRTGCGRGESLAGLGKTAGVLMSVVLVSVALWGQSAESNTGATTAANNPGFLQLPVAHAHFGSWCTGYLTISPENIRFEANGVRGKEDHSFQLTRGQVVFVNYWIAAGQMINAVEIRTPMKNYHFWLLPSAAYFQAGAHWRPTAAASADTLLVSLHYWKNTGKVPDLAAVSAVLAQARAQAAAQASTGQASASGGDASQKMNDHLYVNGYASQVTTNTINTINHMSHW